MTNQKAFLRTKSKNELIRIIQQLQIGLSFYGNEANWAVAALKDDDKDEGVITWIGDDDPPEVAQVMLGKRKPKSDITIQNGVRLPDNKPQLSTQKIETAMLDSAIKEIADDGARHIGKDAKELTDG